jgi:hypothetical protein
MPHFIAERLPPERNQTGFKEVYAIVVDGPNDAIEGARTSLCANVPLDTSHDGEMENDSLRTFISEELARRLGVQNEGDVVDLVVRDFNGIRFGFPVKVHFAGTKRGAEYIQIGTADLEPHFELLRDHEGRFLDLRVRRRSGTMPLSLYFDVAEFSGAEIAEMIGMLSDLYRGVGGDALVIDGITLLDPALVPEGV